MCLVDVLVDCFRGSIFCRSLVYHLHILCRIRVLCVLTRVYALDVFSRCCRNISATVLEIGDPTEIPFSGWYVFFGMRNNPVGERFLVA